LDGAKSSDVSTLIEEAQAAAVASGDSAERSRSRALDPALGAGEVAAARQEMEDAAFRRDRLQTAVQKLGDRQRELEGQEEQARRQVRYDKLKAERDALADELAQVYPPLALQLADLLKRIEESDRQVEFMNMSSLPKGSNRLLVAELVARGLQGFSQGVSNIPRIVNEICLPAFAYSQQRPYTWSRR
jgi:chromosome segregation ATPase